MIKKYAILTLILSLITTPTFTIIPENISKTINFFQDTKKSIFQRFMEYLQEKTGLSYAQEKEKRNQEDCFVEYNQELFQQRMSREIVIQHFKKVHSKNDRKKVCLNMLQEFKNLSPEKQIMMDNLHTTGIKEIFREYYNFLTDEQLFDGLGNYDPAYKLIISEIRKKFYSQEPNIIEIIKLFALLGHNNAQKQLVEIMNSYANNHILKYCQECQQKNNWS